MYHNNQQISSAEIVYNYRQELMKILLDYWAFPEKNPPLSRISIFFKLTPLDFQSILCPPLEFSTFLHQPLEILIFPSNFDKPPWNAN